MKVMGLIEEIEKILGKIDNLEKSVSHHLSKSKFKLPQVKSTLEKLRQNLINSEQCSVNAQNAAGLAKHIVDVWPLNDEIGSAVLNVCQKLQKV